MRWKAPEEWKQLFFSSLLFAQMILFLCPEKFHTHSFICKNKRRKLKVISQLKKSLHCDFFLLLIHFFSGKRKWNGKNENFIACRILKMSSHSVGCACREESLDVCAFKKNVFLFVQVVEEEYYFLGKGLDVWQHRSGLLWLLKGSSRSLLLLLYLIPLISLLLIIYDALNFYFSHFFSGLLLFSGWSLFFYDKCSNFVCLPECFNARLLNDYFKMYFLRKFAF